jgi:tetratricopeptide (TPR) repeat protein
MSPSIRRWEALTVLALLGACSTLPGERPADAPPIARPATPGKPPAAASPEERFEHRQRERAEQALRAGRLAEAALAWEALNVLNPHDEVYRSRLAESRQAVEHAVSQRRARALAAQQRGDHAGAERAWLELLSFDPRHVGAAQALRDIERERHRSSVVGRFSGSPNVVARSANGWPPAPPAGLRPPERAPAPPGQRNQIEHAALLASQGELDAAIALLGEPSAQGAQEPQARQMLAELHVQRADLQRDRDPAAAQADLERALLLNPKLEAARSRLQALKRGTR